MDEAAVSLADLSAMTLTWVDEADVGRILGDAQETGNTPPATDDFFARISMPSVVALPHQCDRMWRGVRTRTRKLVLNADGSPWLFFDLKNDPQEIRNLVGDPAQASEMEELMWLV